MATKKKGSTARTGAKKKVKKTAKKTAAKASKSSSAKKAAPAKRTVTGKKQAKGAGRREVPPPLAGSVTNVNGVVGISTSEGFYPLDHLAGLGETVQLQVTLGAGQTGAVDAVLRALVDYLQGHAEAAIGGIVRCCIGPPPPPAS